MKRVAMRYLLVCLVAFVADMTMSAAVAQIRIVPREKIDSIARPATISNGGMLVESGGRVSMGCIAEDSGVWQHTLSWQNISDEPIVITRLSSSCSCLQADADRKPVGSGKKGSIALRYYPKGHIGDVNHRVTIYTNLSDRVPTAVVSLNGVVKAATDRSDDYPYYRGELLLRQDTIVARRGEEVRVACMNGGERALTIGLDGMLSPNGAKIYTTPQVLQPKQEGDLVVKMSSDVNAGQCVKLYISGLPLPPRQRCVVVKVVE